MSEMDRRGFMKLAGLGGGIVGLTGSPRNLRESRRVH